MRMQLATSLHLRDEIAKREIHQSQTFKSLPESDKEKLEALLNEAFNRADIEWRKIFVSPNNTDEVILG